ncbi:MAG TPA: NADH-quinone oxidoreductase subunit N [Candidatus Binatia bacterium]|nr:NADH-quinone oxidoreductase subunit N [Candidatus Binatia bacterium]
MGTAESLRWFLPEIALTGAILAVVFLDLVTTGSAGRRAGTGPGRLALVGSGLALVLTVGVRSLGIEGLLGAAAPGWLFDRMIVLDAFSVFFKVLLGLALLAVVWMSLGSREVRAQPNEGEYYALLLSSGLAMFLMASAGTLLMAYLSLEFVSLASYVLTGFLRHNRRSGEAALKYLIYGGVASGAMIYGMSWVFGLTGAMDYAGIARGIAALDPASRPALFLGLVLVLAGFGYKIAAVPFHMWAPDVYTGAPIPVTAFLAVGSKAAGFAMLLRFFHFGVGPGGAADAIAHLPLRELASVLCVATMTLGNLAALSQTNLKRLLAYSSIAHAGYALLGFVVFADRGVEALLFYLAVYYAMNLGAFWVVMVVANATGREDLDGYRGLAWRGGALPALALGVFLFSLAGLPPLAGFLGKFYVFAAGVEGRFYALVVLGLVNSVISLYYYARVVKVMFLDQPRPDDPRLTFRPVGDLVALVILSAANLLLILRFEWLLAAVQRAGQVFSG